MDDFKTFFEKTTLELHKTLNPKIWTNEKLNKGIKEQLIKIATKFCAFAKLDHNAVKDFIITGGNANFNYSKYSDIDLHVVIDYDKISKDNNKLVGEYLKDKKNLWKVENDINIVGYNVEVSPQSSSEKLPKNQGSFSLLKDEWIDKPSLQNIHYDDKVVDKKSKSLEQYIDYVLLNHFNDLEEMKKLKTKLKSMRKDGLTTSGEFSIDNLVFKDLRNKGLVDKVKKRVKDLERKNVL